MMKNPNDVKNSGPKMPEAEPLPPLPPPSIEPSLAQEESEDLHTNEWWWDVGGEG